ncbi:hypothetical protein C8R43DRAFT_1127461 [Mycena crocata]|nr:hypothetical protein C8R43DRAFT_1127461 [Mycena crocata]
MPSTSAHVTTIAMPMYPSLHYPSATPTAIKAPVVVLTSGLLSLTAVDVLLILAIVIALLGTFAIRHSKRAESAGGAKPRKAWDSSRPFWVKSIPSPALIMRAQTKPNDTLLAEVPTMWRILGRAKEDSDEAIPEYRKTASQGFL